MTQMLLFPDPRPLVERLGTEFFQQAPEHPGVYLMRDAAETVLYVGKAKNLRKRLASYRVANPDRMRRRHLRLLRAVARIEIEACHDEKAALARESELLLRLRPKFNRAGTWPGSARFLAWRLGDESLDLMVPGAIGDGWHYCGPMGAGAIHLRATVVRLLWSAVHPERGLAGMPEGWFRGHLGEVTSIPQLGVPRPDFEKSEARLRALFHGAADEFTLWVRERTSGRSNPFEAAALEVDLEAIGEFVKRWRDRLPRESKEFSTHSA